MSLSCFSLRNNKAVGADPFSAAVDFELPNLLRVPLTPTIIERFT